MYGRRIILVTASWCASCKGMLDWFTDISIPGLAFEVMDIEEFDLPLLNISSVPTIVFMEDSECVDMHPGTKTRHDLIHHIYSLWPSLPRIRDEN